jgi:hypothetical protein
LVSSGRCWQLQQSLPTSTTLSSDNCSSGHACPDGAGVPQPGAKLPTVPIAYNPATLQAAGVQPYNTYSTTSGTYPGAAAQSAAGLQKWVLQDGTWKLAYTLNDGLALGVPYTMPGYPGGDNPATGLPGAPATDGLRNITGRVNPDGTVTIWAITSTVSVGQRPGQCHDRQLRIRCGAHPVTSFECPGSEIPLPEIRPAAHYTLLVRFNIGCVTGELRAVCLAWIGPATACAVANSSDSPHHRYPGRARLPHAKYRIKANLRPDNQR